MSKTLLTSPAAAKIAPNFIERHGLFDAKQRNAAEESRKMVKDNGIETIRLVFPDQYGLLRGKALTVPAYFGALSSGNAITMAPFFFDTADAIVLNPFSPEGGFEIEGLGGSPNVTMVPDPATMKILPWAPKTAIVFADLYMSNGEPFPLAPRTILKKALAKLADDNLAVKVGIEMEWYLTRIVDDLLGSASLGSPGFPADPMKVAPVARGYNYHLIDHLDEVDEAISPIMRAVVDLGLPLRSLDDEWAPSQYETTFDIMDGLEAADGAALFRTAVKQVAKRNGYLASFMSTPAIEGFYASGWHLHTSIIDATSGQNLMIPDENEALSELGQHYIGGTLKHATAASVFTTQSINGYKRRRPYSLAPDRLTWAFDNRAALMRVISAPGDLSSHVENRVGESCANPYLYIAAQVASGHDGIKHKISPGPISEDPYASDVAQLPTTLADAVDAMESDTFFRKEFGDTFIDYLATMKRSEISRFETWLAENPDESTYVNGITDWEQREYFEQF